MAVAARIATAVVTTTPFLARMSSAVHVGSEEEEAAEEEEEEEEKLVQLKKYIFDGNRLFRGQRNRFL